MSGITKRPTATNVDPQASRPTVSCLPPQGTCNPTTRCLSKHQEAATQKVKQVAMRRRQISLLCYTVQTHTSTTTLLSWALRLATRTSQRCSIRLKSKNPHFSDLSALSALRLSAFLGFVASLCCPAFKHAAHSSHASSRYANRAMQATQSSDSQTAPLSLQKGWNRGLQPLQAHATMSGSLHEP